MTQESSPQIQALHQGIQTELQGYSFYRKAADQTEDPLGKQTFLSLMQEEEDHLRLLKVQYGSLVSEGTWLAMEEAEELVPGEEVETLFPQEDHTLADTLRQDATDLEALDMALEFERRGYQMYQRSAEETDDAEGQALYDFLAKQEQKHYDYIDRARQYLKNEGSWYYDEEELPMFEGG